MSVFGVKHKATEKVAKGEQLHGRIHKKPNADDFLNQPLILPTSQLFDNGELSNINGLSSDVDIDDDSPLSAPIQESAPSPPPTPIDVLNSLLTSAQHARTINEITPSLHQPLYDIVKMQLIRKATALHNELIETNTLLHLLGADGNVSLNEHVRAYVIGLLRQVSPSTANAEITSLPKSSRVQEVANLKIPKSLAAGAWSSLQDVVDDENGENPLTSAFESRLHECFKTSDDEITKSLDDIYRDNLPMTKVDLNMKKWILKRRMKSVAHCLKRVNDRLESTSRTGDTPETMELQKTQSYYKKYHAQVNALMKECNTLINCIEHGGLPPIVKQYMDGLIERCQRNDDSTGLAGALASKLQLR